MKRDAALFDIEPPRVPKGRVRLGLDADVKAARAADVQLSAAAVALLRSLADQIDLLERTCRSPGAKPYDRIPLTGLAREFDDIRDRTFAAVQIAGDPLAAALTAIMAQDMGTPAAVGHPEGPAPD